MNQRIRQYLILTALFFLSSSICSARTIYVTPTGADANDGFSWATAKQHVQAGIKTAGKNNEVWIAAGTYYERIVLSPGVSVYGGFVGTEAARDQRNPHTNVTTLDGQKKGTVVKAPSAATAVSRIDGFVITNGKGSAGGGIYCGNKSSLVIANNVITGNASTFGGGIYCESRSSAKIINNRIVGNTAACTGGIVCATNSTPTITNNTIASNSTTGRRQVGAGIYVISSRPEIANNIIAFNTSGIDVLGFQKPVIKNNDIYGNTAFNGQGIVNPIGKNGNISADPLFKDRANGDYHIQIGSPCIDTGNDSAVEAGWKDMDWEVRQEDFPGVGTALVDIGADEFRYSPPSRPEVEDEGDVTTDATQLLAHWTVEEGGSDIAEVQYTLGTTSGGTEVLGWQTLPDPTQHDFTITGLSLQQNITYYISVKAKNEDDLWSEIGTSDGIVVAVIVRTVREALSLPEGTYAKLEGNPGQGAIVTTDYNATTKTFANRIFYIEDPLRYYGIKVVSQAEPDVRRGDKVNITGTIQVDNATKEAYYDATNVERVSRDNSVPGVLTLTGSFTALGGSNFTMSTPVKPGVTVPPGIGLYNKGMLLKLVGKVMSVDTVLKCFYVDNESGIGIDDTTGHGRGVRVSYQWQSNAGNLINPPLIGWTVGVTGISSSECLNPSEPNPANWQIIRVLRPRDRNDIVVYGQTDTINPFVTLTTPPGEEVNKVAGANVPLGGYAWDIDGGIKTVQLSIDGVNQSGVTYDMATGAWAYTWINPAVNTYNIIVTATDWAGHTGTVTRTVTVKQYASGKIIYVTQTGAGLKNGTSWGNAYDSVATALNSAASGNEVWVAAGTFSGPKKDIGSDSCIFQLKSGVGLYGGFAGGEQVREVRDWVNNETILQDIGLDNTVVRVDNNAAADTTVIDGFTIQNGMGRCFAADWSKYFVGGGIFCGLDSSPTIAHNKIINNNANLWNGDGNGGNGGGIYIDGQGPSSPKIYGNTITNNNARTSGGGIYIDGNEFSSPNIYGNTITNNTANSWGGGIYIDGNEFSSPKIYGNKITNNTSDGGGGIYCDTSAARISNNVINYNTGYSGAGLVLRISPNAKIVNNTFIGNNDGGQGGTSDAIYAVSFYGSGNLGALIANNIITQNLTGIRAVDNDPTLKNNCVYLNGPEWSERINNYIVEGSGTLDHSTDINVDPKMIRDNIHIQGNSPCIGAGYNDAVLSGDKDIDEEERKMPTGGVVDIGADESNGTVYYDFTLTAYQDPCQISQHSVCTANVKNPVSGIPVSGYMVYIDSIEGATDWNWQPGSNGTKNGSSGFGNTNASGNLQFWVTRAAEGMVTVTCHIGMPYQIPTVEVLTIWFETPQTPPVTGSWPMFMHDPQHTGMSDVADTIMDETFNGGAPNWQAAIPTFQHQYYSNIPIYDSSPVTLGNKVVVGAWTNAVWPNESTGDVYCFTANTGSRIWKASDQGNGITPAMFGVSTTPCINSTNNTVYVTSFNGYLYCLNLNTGAQVWSKKAYEGSTNPGIYSSPILYNSVVYVVNNTGVIYSFDSNTGNAVRNPIYLDPGQANINEVFSTPAIKTLGGTTYLLVGTAAVSPYNASYSRLYRVNLTASPATVSYLVLSMWVRSSPTIVGDIAYVGTSNPSGTNFYKIQIEPFAILQSRAMQAEVQTSPAYGYKSVYFGCDTGWVFYRLKTSDITTMTTYIETNLPTLFYASAALQNTGTATPGLVYIANDSGRLYAMNGSNLTTPIASYYNGAGFGQGVMRSSAALAYIDDGSGHMDRWVFVTSRKGGGTLYAFKTAR